MWMSSIAKNPVSPFQACARFLVRPRPWVAIRLRPLWTAAPLFTAGIALARLGALDSASLWGVAFIVTLTLALVAWKRTGATVAALVCALTACFCAGGLRLSVAHQSRTAADCLRARIAANPGDASVELIGELTAWPEPAVRRVRCVVNVRALVQAGELVPSCGRVRLTLPLERPEHVRAWERLAVRPGAQLKISARLTQTARFRNPGGFDLETRLNDDDEDAVGVIVDLQQLSPGDGRGLLAQLGRLRLEAFSLLQRDFEPRVQGLLFAAALGGRSFLDAEWAESFRRSGTFHLLVISGSHFALLAGAVSAALAAVTRRRLATAVVTLSVVWLYAWMVGADPPVMRAAVAVTVWQTARLFYRRPDPLNAFGATVLILLFMQPTQLFNPGFQLTAGAVAALVGGAAPLLDRLRRVGAWRPTKATPYPPSAPRAIRRLAEALYWSPRAFAAEMERSPVAYRLDKSPAARRLENCGVSGLFPSATTLHAVNLQTLLRWSFGLIVASGCVQIALLPFNLYYFNRLAPIGLLGNVTAEAAMAAMMATTVAYFIAHLGGDAVVWPFAQAVEATVRIFIFTAETSAQVRWASWRAPHLEGGLTVVYALYAAGVAGLCLSLARWRPLSGAGPASWAARLAAVAAAWCLAAGAATVAPPRAWTAPAPGWMRVTFLDVGQGDCALVELPTGETFLIDAGGRANYARDGEIQNFREDAPGVGERVVSRVLWARSVRRLDGIFATHSDSDHIQGFTEVVENFPIRQAWTSPARSTDPVFRAFATALERRRVPLAVMRAGAVRRIGAVTISALSPPTESLAEASDNDRSLVLRIEYGNRSFVFTGDIERAAERRLLESHAPLRCDVVKAPHHGSRSSSEAEFVRAVAAEHVVFCAPRRSPFGHPHPEVVARYAQELPRATLWQTGTDGAVTFETDGTHLHGVGFASGRTTRSE